MPRLLSFSSAFSTISAVSITAAFLLAGSAFAAAPSLNLAGALADTKALLASGQAADIVVQAWGAADAQTKADTIVVLTVTGGDDRFINTNQ